MFFWSYLDFNLTYMETEQLKAEIKILTAKFDKYHNSRLSAKTDEERLHFKFLADQAIKERMIIRETIIKKESKKK